MKAFGYIKPYYAINDFVEVIFFDDGNYYIQESDGQGKIISFVKIKDTEIIEKFEVEKYVDVGHDKLHLYFMSNNKVYLGSLMELRQTLIPLAKSDRINPIAKLLIAAKYKLNGLLFTLIGESNKYFIERRIHTTVVFEDYLNDYFIPVEDTYSDFIFSRLNKIIQYVEKEKILTYDEVIFLRPEKNSVLMGDLSLELSSIFKLIFNKADFQGIEKHIVSHANSLTTFIIENDEIDDTLELLGEIEFESNLNLIKEKIKLNYALRF